MTQPSTSHSAHPLQSAYPILEASLKTPKQTVQSKYSTTAVEQILSQAVRDNAETPFTWETVLSMGAELGLPPETIAAAERRWQSTQRTQQQEIAKRRQRHRQFRQYIGVNALLITINLWVCGTISWAIWPILGWGFSLMLPPSKTSVAKYSKTNESVPLT